MRRSGARRSGRPADSERGAAVAEFVMVVPLLTVLTLAVLQLGLAMHVRNSLLDAAAEGARYAALADNGLADGRARTRELIATSVGARYAADVRGRYGWFAGHTSAEIRVVAPLPLLGLLGVDGGLEVVGHAAVETLD